MIDFLLNLFTNKVYSIIITILLLIFIICYICSKIKYSCLKNIIKYIAEAENSEYSDGEAKHLMVNNFVYKNKILNDFTIFDDTINRLVDYVYNNYNSFYIKRLNTRLSNVLKDIIDENKLNTKGILYIAEDILEKINHYNNYDRYRDKDKYNGKLK